MTTRSPLAPPAAPRLITTGVRSRASKEITVGAAPEATHAPLPAARAKVAIPHATNGGVAMQAIQPHPAVHAAIAAAQQHPAAAQARAVQRGAIANVQVALKAAGHDPGSTNGELDHQTRGAIRSFQASHGLPATGTIDATTHAAVTAVSETTTGKRAGRDRPTGGAAVVPSGGAINHAGAKGAPVVMIATHLPPIPPHRVPPAGTVHPASPGPPGSSSHPLRPSPVMTPPHRLPPASVDGPAKFGQQASHGQQASPAPAHAPLGAPRSAFGPGGAHLAPAPINAPAHAPLGAPRSAFGPGGAQNVHGGGFAPPGHKAPAGGVSNVGPSRPPMHSGATPGGASSATHYVGGAGSGPGGAAAGETGGRSQGFRPGGSAGRRAQGGSSSAHTTGASTMASKGNTKGWRSTGWRICLVLTASITSLSNAAISVNPQMDFRGENMVIDTTTVGPNSTLTIPSVGTIPQIAGGTASTAVPGTLFSPAQAGALDFKMSIANQGNAVSFTANSTLTSTTLAFAALLFGTEVELDQGGMTTGVSPAGAYTGG